jgi:hypothetical protein
MAEEEEKSAKATVDNRYDDLVIEGIVVRGQGQTQWPMKPTTLVGETTTSQINLSSREEAAILDRIWPGSCNITFLTRFVVVRLSGDWTAYLQFAHWADTQSMEHPDLAITLDDWLLLKWDAGLPAA